MIRPRLLCTVACVALLASPATALAQAAPEAPKAKAPAPAQKKTAAAPAIGGVQPSLLGQYGDWAAYAATPQGKKICFALAKPATSQTNPPNRPRDSAYIFISTRPADKVKDEVSVVIGYPFKEKSVATVEVGATKLSLYTDKDGAWISSAAEEARLIDAMRKGSDLVVKGTSGRGTVSTDNFSLKGVGQALDRVAQECR
jgi:invasion protein IalB